MVAVWQVPNYGLAPQPGLKAQNFDKDMGAFRESRAAFDPGTPEYEHWTDFMGNWADLYGPGGTYGPEQFAEPPPPPTPQDDWIASFQDAQVAALQRAFDAQAAEAQRRAAAEQARREEVERVRRQHFAEIDKMFKDRAPFYQQVHDTLLSQGKRRASDWNRKQRRQNTFGLLRRGLAGGSAEVQVRKRQQDALGDVMADIAAGAREGQRQAEQADLTVRDRARSDVLQGLQWQGASAYQPYLSSLPDYDAANRDYFQGVFRGLADGGAFDE